MCVLFSVISWKLLSWGLWAALLPDFKVSLNPSVLMSVICMSITDTQLWPKQLEGHLKRRMEFLAPSLQRVQPIDFWPPVLRQNVTEEAATAWDCSLVLGGPLTRKPKEPDLGAWLPLAMCHHPKFLGLPKVVLLVWNPASNKWACGGDIVCANCRAMSSYTFYVALKSHQ